VCQVLPIVLTVATSRATDHNGYQQIIPPSREMGMGLKRTGAQREGFGIWESVPNRCPTGMKTNALGAIAYQAKARVDVRLAHPCHPVGPVDLRS